MGLARPTQLGRFELLLELGHGGMAELVLARNPGVAGFAKLLAIKRILPHLAQDKQFVEMFENESRIAGHLTHPNVCSVFELGLEGGELYLVMEYLDGVSWHELSRRVSFGDDTRLRLTAGVLAQAAEGLHYAHTLKDLDGNPTPVIHRDVSPQNLFVTVDGVCKVLDFGVAKMMTEGPRTRTGLIKGKLPYMSPEQIRGEPVDARADVFALAIVCWEALTGDSLFDRDTDFLIYKAVSEEPIPLATARRPELPGAVDHVLAKALARDREYRYASTRELSAALSEAAGRPFTPAEIAKTLREACGAKLDERTRAIAAATSSRAPSASDTIADPAETKSMLMRRDSVVVKRTRSRTKLVAFGAIAVVAIAVVGGIAIGRMSRTAEPEPAPVPPAPVVVAKPPEPEKIDKAVDTAVDAIKDLEKLRDKPTRDIADIRKAVEPLRRLQRALPEVVAAPGTLTVASEPYATIYIDGTKLDVTPIAIHEIASGHHKIRAVLEDGRDKTLDVNIQPGEETNLGKLTW